jgi:hypothetical protein
MQNMESSMNNEKMRAAFEAWAIGKKWSIDPAREESLDDYMDSDTEIAWYGYQAAAEASAAEIVRLTSELAQAKEAAASWEQTANTKCGQLADEIAGRCDDRIAARLAHPQPSALPVIEQEPVAWRIDMPGTQEFVDDLDDACDMLTNDDGIAVPLYERPQPSADDARDAARYRYLRECNSGSHVIVELRCDGNELILAEDDADEAIDKEMKAAK